MKLLLGRPGAFGFPIAAAAAVVLLTFYARAATAGTPVSAPPQPVPSAGTPGATARDSYTGPPTLLANGSKLKVGAYAGLGGAYTRLMGQDSGLVSLEGAILLDHRLSLGLAGYAFSRTPGGPAAADGSRQQFGAGYGGFALRYSVFGGLPVYGTLGLVLGAGAVNLHRRDGWDDETSWDDGYRDSGDRAWNAGRFDTFLFVQPEIALNANVTRWLRLGATGGYRFTGGVGRFGLSESDLNGIVVGGNLQLGWF